MIASSSVYIVVQNDHVLSKEDSFKKAVPKTQVVLMSSGSIVTGIVSLICHVSFLF